MLELLTACISKYIQVQIHTPNGSIFPCIHAFHKINIGYAVARNPTTLHCMQKCLLNENWQRVMHDCASILDSISKKTSCFNYFSHGASLHQYSFSRMIFTQVIFNNGI